MTTPSTRYAKSGDASIAYQVVGDGPIDLVLVPRLFTHVEHQWEEPSFARFLDRLTSPGSIRGEQPSPGTQVDTSPRTRPFAAP